MFFLSTDNVWIKVQLTFFNLDMNAEILEKLCECVCHMSTPLRKSLPLSPKGCWRNPDEAREVQTIIGGWIKKFLWNVMSFSEEKTGSHLATPTIIKQKHSHTQRTSERDTRKTPSPRAVWVFVCLSMYRHALFVSCLATLPHPYDVTLPDFIGQSDWPTSILTLYFSTQWCRKDEQKKRGGKKSLSLCSYFSSFLWWMCWIICDTLGCIADPIAHICASEWGRQSHGIESHTGAINAESVCCSVGHSDTLSHTRHDSLNACELTQLSTVCFSTPTSCKYCQKRHSDKNRSKRFLNQTLWHI